MTDPDEARVALSEIIEITENTIDETFHRHADLDALYRRCPTAFWLAPDGDGMLPPPDGPSMPQAVLIGDPRPEATDPPAVHGMAAGIGRALIVAGPIFVATALALEQAQFDRHWSDPFARAAESLFLAPLTAVVGGILALLPVLVGVLTLGEVGLAHPRMRAPAAWALTGGMMGIAIAALFGADGGATIALVATSVACAAIARTGVNWTEPEPA